MSSMTPTLDFLYLAEKHIRLLFDELRPVLLKGHGEIEHQIKSDNSVVTEMDLMVEQRLRAVLHELDPSISFSGEETGVDYSQKTFWLADPIDGTESFIRGLPFSSNMVALIDNGQPVMSVIYNFFLNEYFLAIKGHGATKNGHPIHVSNRPLSRSFVIAGHRLGLEGFVNTIPKLSKKVQGLPQMYSSGYEFASVACGRMDGLIAWNKDAKAWDRAPGTLLVQEAGGRVENIGTPGYDYRNPRVLAANPVIFDELMKFVMDNTKFRQKHYNVPNPTQRLHKKLIVRS